MTELTDSILRDKLRFLMKDVSDLERLIGRLNLGTATPRDLVALARSIGQAPLVNEILSDAKSLLLHVLSENIFELPEIRDLIARAISDEPPINLSDGGVIRDGFDKELDELRGISTSAKQTIAAFEEQERTRTGIANLKIRFNNVFGYYIEISKGNVSRVPDDYERRQTLANAERYTTPQLKEWELKIARGGRKDRPDRVRSIPSGAFKGLRRNAKTAIDRSCPCHARCLVSLAETAAKRNFVCPVLHDGDEIEIKERPPSGCRSVTRRVIHPERYPDEQLHRPSADYHRREHGRQIDDPAADRDHSDTRTDRFVCSGDLGKTADPRPHLDPRRSVGRPGVRTLDVHGRDDRDGSNIT